MGAAYRGDADFFRLDDAGAPPVGPAPAPPLEASPEEAPPPADDAPAPAAAPAAAPAPPPDDERRLEYFDVRDAEPAAPAEPPEADGHASRCATVYYDAEEWGRCLASTTVNSKNQTKLSRLSSSMW